MKIISPAKLTLSLSVGAIHNDKPSSHIEKSGAHIEKPPAEKRMDGYHEVNAEMVSLDLADELEVEPADVTSVEVIARVSRTADKSFTDNNTATENMGGKNMGDIYIGDVGLPNDNLVKRALDMVGMSAAVKIRKAIPAGAGLGGGSSNAAVILRWAKMQNPDLAGADILTAENIAKNIGADVVFCLSGGRAKVSGMGEVVEPLDFVEATYTILIPPFGCATAEVYKVWDGLDADLKTGIGKNDLEAAALKVAPALSSWRDYLGELSGTQPHLAGSGSTWFVEGEFEGEFEGTKTLITKTTPAVNGF